MATKKNVTRKRNSYPAILEYANVNRDEGLFVDVTIAVNNVAIPANRLILSCCSKVFERMFKTKMKERYEPIVNLTADAVDSVSARALIDFMYSGTITINNDNVLQLLAAADYLQIDEVKLFCVEFLESILCPANCRSILESANLHRLESLQKQIYEMISNNFEEFASTDDFKTFNKDDVLSCLVQLNRNQVKESSVFKAILNWTKFEEQVRKKSFFDLINHVKFEKLSPFFLQNEVATERLVKENSHCANLVMSALLKLLVQFQDTTKTRSSKILSIGGYGGTSGKVMEVFPCEDEPTTAYPNAPFEVDSGWSVKLHEFVYCIGGRSKISDGDQAGMTNKVCRFSVNKLEFEEVASLKYARLAHSAALMSDTVVVTGGKNVSGSYLRSSESYIPQFNEWRLIASTKQAKSGHVLASCKGCLYNIGGYTGLHSESSVERLKGLREEWEEVAPMNERRQGLAAISCGHCIYAIGGSNSTPSTRKLTKTVEKYDPFSNTWSYVKSMSFCRVGHAACELHGKVYVVGGHDEYGNTVQEIECYDPEKDSWSVVDRTIYPLYNHSLVVV